MKSGILAVCLLAAAPALADDRAMIVGNENYSDAADIKAADDVMGAAQALRTAGFTVISGRDLATKDLRDLMSRLLIDRDQAERIVIVLSGHFARSERDTWFLGTEASGPDLATVGGTGLSLATVLEIASAAPGGAVVLLGTEDRRLPLGEGLAPGIGLLDIPQGVTVVRGDAAAIAQFAERDLTRRGVSLAALAAAQPDLGAEGFLSPLVPFRPSEGDTGNAGAEDAARAAELAFWDATRTQGTPEAYDAYLRRYPLGIHAEEARAEAARIRAEPSRQARLAEEALNLSRDQRREIQRSLALLGYDPRGIDGVFGPGSRRAITEWQRAEGYATSGYLDRGQIQRLASQSEARAAQLEREARLRQAAEERADRAYWDSTGAAGDEIGLRSYLDRYPDGLFADIATARLGVIEDQRRAEAAGRDRAAWDVAEDANTVESYRAYLREFPRGAFAPEANRRIAILLRPVEPDRDRTAREEEAALNLNPVTRNMIEARLDAMGFKPGRVDGTFDENTRRAIRRYQRSRDLPATGYLNEATVVRLLADTVRGFGN